MLERPRRRPERRVDRTSHASNCSIQELSRGMLPLSDTCRPLARSPTRPSNASTTARARGRLLASAKSRHRRARCHARCCQMCHPAVGTWHITWCITWHSTWRRQARRCQARSPRHASLGGRQHAFEFRDSNRHAVRWPCKTAVRMGHGSRRWRWRGDSRDQPRRPPRYSPPPERFLIEASRITRPEGARSRV